MQEKDTRSEPSERLEVAFTDKPVSGWGGLVAMVRFFDKRGVRELLHGRRGGGRGAECLEERLEAGEHVAIGRRELVNLAAVRHQVARLARVGEERDRRFRVDEHEVPEAPELHSRELGEVGDPL